MDFSLISLGCPKNLVDSEKMVQQLQENNFRLVTQNTTEQLLIINTCAFIKEAIKESREKIKENIQQKIEGKIKYLVITGCWPSRENIPKLKKLFPEVDLWINIKTQPKIANKINLFLQKNTKKINQVYTKLTPTHYAYVKISEGCNNHCSYCTIPQIRGSFKSRPIKTILEEIKRYITLGVKEIILVAEDTTIWGMDIYNRPALDLLLEKICDLPNLEWVRIMYAYPSHITDELIQIMQKRKNICKYLDMPIQHISSNILKKMNRKYDKKFLENLFLKLKSSIPDIAIRTTFIIGFPEETEEDIKEIITFIKKEKIEQIGCFAFSPETNTPAYNFNNKIDKKIINLRIKKIMSKQYKIVQLKNKKMINKNLGIIYEGNGQARSFREAPNIDSLILIENPDNLKIGSKYQAKIIDYRGYDLIARIN
jgi:ribosomal protein S12 methylthiotransferase